VQRWVNSGVTPKEAGERVGRSASSVKNKLRWMEQRQRDLLHLKTPEADQ
jgi:DNA-binding CsgD family transcriptional regulator